MPVQIVAHSRLLRELFSNLCRGAQIPVLHSAPNLLDLPTAPSDPVAEQADREEAPAPDPMLSTTSAPETLILYYSNAGEAQILADLEQFRQLNPAPSLVLVTAQSFAPQNEARLTQLAHAVFPENKSAEALVALLRVVQAGYRAFAPAPADNTQDPAAQAVPMAAAPPIAPPGAHQAPVPQDVHLSNRERTILQRLMFGASNKSIANDLGICEATVKVHLRTCFRKIGVQNRTQAAIWATETLGPPSQPSPNM